MDKPSSLASGFFRGCLLVFLGMVALSWAVDVLDCIWPWIVTVAVVVAAVYVAVWLIRRCSGKW